MRMPPQFSRDLLVPDWLFRESLYLTQAGWERMEPGEIYPRPWAAMYDVKWDEGRILPDFAMAYFLEGKGELETRLGKQSVRAGEAILLAPGEWHRHRPLPETGWAVCWVFCNGALPHQWHKQLAFHLQGNKPVIQDHDLFRAGFQRLIHAIHANPTGNSAVLSWQALALFSHFVRDIRVQDAGSSAASSDRVWRARDFIMNHTHAAIRVADVAAHAGCNRRTLEIQFKQATGRTVLEEIQHCRMERARALLTETDLAIKQVVHRSGFQSRNQMQLLFRKVLGITPCELRRKHSTGARKSD